MLLFNFGELRLRLQVGIDCNASNNRGEFITRRLFNKVSDDRARSDIAERVERLFADSMDSLLNAVGIQVRRFRCQRSTEHLGWSGIGSRGPGGPLSQPASVKPA